MKRLLIACLIALPFGASADDLQSRQQASAGAIKEFGEKLKGELGRAMKEGGPGRAIEVCQKVAPAIAEEQSAKTGWRVARTSLKTRNSANVPDAWEAKVLESFEARKAKGEPVDSLAFAEVVEQNGKQAYRFMKAIPTAEVCLKCHGENIEPGIAAKLNELYPADKARGFKLGDIRGAFTVTQPM
jgi:hypothetical protein